MCSRFHYIYTPESRHLHKCSCRCVAVDDDEEDEDDDDEDYCEEDDEDDAGQFFFWKESLAGASGNAYGALGLFPHVSSWALETKLFQIIEACSTLAQQGKLTQNS